MDSLYKCLSRTGLTEMCLLVCIFFFPVELSTMFPDKLSIGMEIRVKVSDYVRDRIGKAAVIVVNLFGQPS